MHALVCWEANPIYFLYGCILHWRAKWCQLDGISTWCKDDLHLSPQADGSVKGWTYSFSQRELLDIYLNSLLSCPAFQVSSGWAVKRAHISEHSAFTLVCCLVWGARCRNSAECARASWERRYGGSSDYNHQIWNRQNCNSSLELY